jgi:hypothetical protein
VLGGRVDLLSIRTGHAGVIKTAGAREESSTSNHSNENNNESDVVKGMHSCQEIERRVEDGFAINGNGDMKTLSMGKRVSIVAKRDPESLAHFIRASATVDQHRAGGARHPLPTTTNNACFTRHLPYHSDPLSMLYLWQQMSSLRVNSRAHWHLAEAIQRHRSQLALPACTFLPCSHCFTLLLPSTLSCS